MNQRATWIGQLGTKCWRSCANCSVLETKPSSWSRMIQSLRRWPTDVCSCTSYTVQGHEYHHWYIYLEETLPGVLARRRGHAQHGFHTQVVREIFSLGLQSSPHIGRKLVKWLYHHHQVVLLPLTLPHPQRTTVHSLRPGHPWETLTGGLPQRGRATISGVVKRYKDRRHPSGIPRLIACHVGQTRRSSAHTRTSHETRAWTSKGVS
jgi:hypothetical protein